MSTASESAQIGDDREHVLATQALPQHEGVLRADGDDEREPESESGDAARRGGRHASTVGARASCKSSSVILYDALASLTMDSTSPSSARSPPSSTTARSTRRPRAARHALGGQPAHQGARDAAGRRARATRQAGTADDRGRRRTCASPARSTLLDDAMPRAEAALDEHRAGDPPSRLAVNADSLATWVLPALARARRPTSPSTSTARTRTTPPHCCAPARSWPPSPPTPSRCRAARSTPTRSHALPPDGDARPSSPAGSPAASIAEALAVAPVVVFDRKDDLQDRYLRRRTRAPARRRGTTSRARPTSPRRSGSGSAGGCCPTAVAEPERAASWSSSTPATHVDVVLYWQQWTLHTPALERGRRRDQDSSGGPSALSPSFWHCVPVV